MQKGIVSTDISRRGFLGWMAGAAVSVYGMHALDAEAAETGESLLAVADGPFCAEVFKATLPALVLVQPYLRYAAADDSLPLAFGAALEKATLLQRANTAAGMLALVSGTKLTDARADLVRYVQSTVDERLSLIRSRLGDHGVFTPGRTPERPLEGAWIPSSLVPMALGIIAGPFLVDDQGRTPLLTTMLMRIERDQRQGDTP